MALTIMIPFDFTTWLGLGLLKFMTLFLFDIYQDSARLFLAFFKRKILKNWMSKIFGTLQAFGKNGEKIFKKILFQILANL